MPLLRRGGIRQRLSRVEAEADGNVVGPESVLGRYLVMQWAWGFQTLPKLQLTAALAVEDMVAGGGECPGSLRALAALGSNGKYPANMLHGLLESSQL